MIDTHCHIDLYPDPLAVARRCEKAGVATLAMTNLPSHFAQSMHHLRGFRHIRVALGLHPLYAERHPAEYNLFDQYVEQTSYIGEVGLDFSREGLVTKQQQIRSFHFVLDRVRSQKKLLSIHSRGAEADVLRYLTTAQCKMAIFHWYTGSVRTMKEAAEKGYFFSINPAMTRSEKGRALIQQLPPQRILTETDGPFVQHNSNPVEPPDVGLVVSYLATIWQQPLDNVSRIIKANFDSLIKMLR